MDHLSGRPARARFRLRWVAAVVLAFLSSGCRRSPRRVGQHRPDPSVAPRASTLPTNSNQVPTFAGVRLVPSGYQATDSRTGGRHLVFTVQEASGSESFRVSCLEAGDPELAQRWVTAAFRFGHREAGLLGRTGVLAAEEPGGIEALGVRLGRVALLVRGDELSGNSLRAYLLLLLRENRQLLASGEERLYRPSLPVLAPRSAAPARRPVERPLSEPHTALRVRAARDQLSSAGKIPLASFRDPSPSGEEVLSDAILRRAYASPGKARRSLRDLFDSGAGQDTFPARDRSGSGPSPSLSVSSPREGNREPNSPPYSYAAAGVPFGPAPTRGQVAAAAVPSSRVAVPLEPRLAGPVPLDPRRAPPALLATRPLPLPKIPPATWEEESLLTKPRLPPQPVAASPALNPPFPAPVTASPAPTPSFPASVTASPAPKPSFPAPVLVVPPGMQRGSPKAGEVLSPHRRLIRARKARVDGDLRGAYDGFQSAVSAGVTQAQTDLSSLERHLHERSYVLLERAWSGKDGTAAAQLEELERTFPEVFRTPATTAPAAPLVPLDPPQDDPPASPYGPWTILALGLYSWGLWSLAEYLRAPPESGE